MDLLEGFFKFLKTHQLPLEDQNRCLLAVSGGLDSMVMAHLFYRAGLSFAIAHCNFQLRGPESDEDEVFVEQVALDFEVPFFVKRFETKDYARKKGVSIQMAARELRYDWFEKIRIEQNFSGIATAHHLNDSVETALLNFARGAGLPGLSGIAAVSGNLIRPLLFASRSDILEYSRTHGITWREDSSNLSDDYARNFVRRHIIPRLEELNPNFPITAARNMERLREADNNLTFLLNNYLFEPDQTHQKLEIQKLTQLPAPQQALRTWLKPYGFDAEQARQLAENLDHVGLTIHSIKGHKLLIDREYLLLLTETEESKTNEAQAKLHPVFQVHEDDLMLNLEDGTRLFFLRMPPLAPFDSILESPADPCAVLLDVEKLKFPLHLRHWTPGDVFQPLGMGGKRQKLQDFFTNHKLSRFEKDAVWLLFNGDDQLIWVLGLRQDERFKTDSKTTKTLKINWIK